MFAVKVAQNLLITIGLVLIFVGASAAVPGQELLVAMLLAAGVGAFGLAGLIDWFADRYAA